MYSEEEYVVLFKALADETRLKIVKMLIEEDKCPCHILKAFNITQPTLSYHTKILCEAGIIVGKRKGAVMECSVNKEKIVQIQMLFDSLANQIENNSMETPEEKK